MSLQTGDFGDITNWPTPSEIANNEVSVVIPVIVLLKITLAAVINIISLRMNFGCSQVSAEVLSIILGCAWLSVLVWEFLNPSQAHAHTHILLSLTGVCRHVNKNGAVFTPPFSSFYIHFPFLWKFMNRQERGPVCNLCDSVDGVFRCAWHALCKVALLFFSCWLSLASILSNFYFYLKW